MTFSISLACLVRPLRLSSAVISIYSSIHPIAPLLVKITFLTSIIVKLIRKYPFSIAHSYIHRHVRLVSALKASLFGIEPYRVQ